MPDLPAEVRAAIDALARTGFDLAQPFDAHACARELGIAALADPERPFGLLIGNTRALWPIFLAARAADRALRVSPDPLDLYTERTIGRIVDTTIPDARVRFGHLADAEGTFLPLSRLAELSGLGTLAPTHLVVHPTFGPWIALRAIVTCPGTPVSVPRPSPCCHCDVTCTGRLADALSATGPDAWRTWVAMRDACPVGRAHRYDEIQIRYHYTKDLSLLEPPQVER